MQYVVTPSQARDLANGRCAHQIIPARNLYPPYFLIISWLIIKQYAAYASFINTELFFLWGNSPTRT
jgi:hypothetical protein